NGVSVHFLCPEHPTIKLVNEYAYDKSKVGYKLVCSRCQVNSDYTPVKSRESLKLLEEKALALHDQDIYKDAKLIRLDDYYIPEIKRFDAIPKSTNYSIKADVKTDKDGDTIIVLYVGHKGDEKRAQIFIKPEKLQLSHDHKDLDPGKVLAKIELTLKDRCI